MRHSRLWRNLSVVVVALGLLLSACGGSGEETPTPGPVEMPMPGPLSTTRAIAGEPGTIRFAIYEWQRAAYEDLVELFEETNPGLHVQLVSLEEIEGSGSTEWPGWALRLVSAADVAYMPIHAEMTKMGLVRDLTPFMEAAPNFQPDDFYPGTLERYRWDGGTWALPTMVDFVLICYDKSAFDEAGVPYPEPGWTWDEFTAKARALTVREGGQVTRWGFALRPSSSDAPRPFIEDRAGPLIDMTTDPPTPRFDRPEVVEAVRWYTDLFQERPDGTSVFDSRTLYYGRVAAMWVDRFSGWQWARQRGRVGVVPFPADTPDSRTTPVWTGGHAIVMSAGTSQPDVAWRWMNFLSRQAISGRGIQYLPARRSVAETSGFWDTLDEGLADALRYAVDHAYTMSGVPGYDVGYRALRRALDAILSGKKSVEEAIIEAQAQAMADIQETLAYLAEVTPVPPFVVAPLEGQEPASEEVVTITFAPGPGSLSMQRYHNLARLFHETHFNILVEVKPAPSPDLRDLQSLANAADCFPGYPTIHDPQNRAAILNLEPLLEADPSFTTDVFYPPLLEPFTWQGQLWGLPAEVEPYVVEYNKDLFDAAGLDYPAPDWTIDDFLALAVALTQGEGQARRYGFVPQAYEGHVLPLILERLGARLIDERVDPPALSFNAPATVEALRWYANLSTVHGVRPVFVTDVAELAEPSSFYTEREALINEGRAAMWTSSSAESAVAYGRGGLNIGVAPLPIVPGGSGGYLSSRGYFISAQTEARQACWEWITFLTGQVEAAEAFPARRSVAESEAYRQQVGAERAAAYRASVAGLERSFQTFSEGGWLREVMYWLFQAYGQVLEGDASVEAALSKAQRKADDYRTCVVARDAFSNQEGWQACLKEVDPTLPDFLFEADEEE